ncbi:MAG: aminotransferase class I/II-fold pyridoxal phosphate-dependent enzyme [Candidatus Marinimicrobia bacterium]|jgi:methionine-gamma-lyase|nr:aminotransferase class I/II-fold pyridoxal phosphate-dependent enzyme [Candidatus Neomarinimicrobiota bacterium]MBT5955930.1 aminotransferase class I/II-fold pyridoxal phosphate-dependent enzyme [Candidatus Neomarinimicrobiota bacterium]MBT6871215.1 aminotransferase class I/II-fold pyridoxal phosphate-dependent enzyme [Candidatus Neomarinimicrobiota bacterium]MBT7376649.1 aminotransferase class I/II-fold pyridoxal phosphate-dependent enzyme [Candidatus Neomarinimicrobiota bacterium]|tara:strand:- start:178 stop:1380 length:1203 start_codon:yes stop_codon:yes gene_type:complete
MSYDPATKIHELSAFGEFGGVNPSITDSSTYTFLKSETMKELFESEIEGCFLYSRHWNPSNKYLSDAISALENSEASQITASGISAIACTILQICKQGDELISSRTIYGGTYALFKNILPRFGITVKFVDVTDLTAVESAISNNTKLIYCETISNPLLDISDLPALSELAHSHDMKLVVDNTFSPMLLTPINLGADVVIHSMTKFINGTSDCVAGCISSTKEFVSTLSDVNDGMCMLLGPVLDSFRSASILKNIHTLHIRMQQHSKNALYISEGLKSMGIKVMYPGLKNHPQHDLMTSMMNEKYGYSGILAMDVGEESVAEALMEKMQNANIGLLAVSLGYFKTLFSLPGNSTSSEISDEEQVEMGLSKGIIRLSVGLDENIERTFEKMKSCIKEVGIRF